MSEAASTGGWIANSLAEQGVSWTAQEVTNLERALEGTSPQYRTEVLRSLVNAGYRPSDELFTLVALFGKFAEIGFTIPEHLRTANTEFEAVIDRLVDYQAESKELFQGFALSVQRVVEAVSERLKEQANDLATDYVSAALAAKEAELRRTISVTIGEEVRGSLRRALDESKEIIAAIPGAGGGIVKGAGGPKEVAIPVPMRFVARGGIALTGKSLLPLAIASAAALWVGVMFGHAFPRPEVLREATLGHAVASQRAQMPADVRAWVDRHSH